MKLDSTRVPVKLYAAVKDQTVRFHILEQKSRTRVKQHMVEADTGKEVTNEEVQKGFEVEPGTFVILDKAELEKLEPEPSREIEIARSCRRKRFHLNSTIGLTISARRRPDGLLCFSRSSKEHGKEGIARWIMRSSLCVGALCAQDDHLRCLRCVTLKKFCRL